MNAVPSFPILDTPVGGEGAWAFVKATLTRITWRHVVVVTLVQIAYSWVPSGVTQSVNPATPLPQAPPLFWLSGIVIRTIVAVSLLIAVMAADEAVARGRRRLPTYAFAIFVGSIVAAVLQYEVRLLLDLRTMLSSAPTLIRITQPAYVAFASMVDGGIATFIYVSIRTSRLAAARYRDAELARSHARRSTFESRLQAMQARVEPTFLFNTLAQVRALYQTDVALAGTMLDELIAYLRAALPHLRETSSTLGKEIELARAYLNIVRIRLGQRLAFDIEVPDALKDARLPPMMLLPLIDHALVYGLGPAHDGGTIQIATTIVDDRIRLSIRDGGAGFVPEQGTQGLQDIEARLAALYGDRGSLRLETSEIDHHPAGSRAILEIPYERHDGGHR